MNKLTIIGNLTKDPEMRTTSTGVNACTFTVAVNRRKKPDGTQEADFFRVTAWRGLGDLCCQYLSKSSRVCVTGLVSVSPYLGKDGTPCASMEVMADEVEFLSSSNNR